MEVVEKRRAPRFSYERPISCFCGDQRVEGVFSVNLSMSGILLRFTEDLPRFQDVKLEIPFEDEFSKTISCSGHLVRNFANGVENYWGVEFSNILPRDRNRILDKSNKDTKM